MGANALKSWLWKFGAMALALLVPAGLNVTVGNSLGVWWAPFPVWMFLLTALGFPLAAAAVVPAAVFVILGVGLLASRRGFAPAVPGFVGMSCLIHAAWMLYLFREGVERLGLAYTGSVFGLGTIVLAMSLWLLVVAKRRHDIQGFVLSIWFVMLWWAWWATPWLGEAI